MAHSLHEPKPFCKVGGRQSCFLNSREDVSQGALLSRGRSRDSQFTFLSYLPWRSLWEVSRLLSSSIWEQRRIINLQLSPTPHSGSEREVLPVCATQRSTSLSAGSAITCHRRCGAASPLPQLPWLPLVAPVLLGVRGVGQSTEKSSVVWKGTGNQTSASFPFTSITVGKSILLGSSKRGIINIASES